jgi:hypothetical protein
MIICTIITIWYSFKRKSKLIWKKKNYQLLNLPFLLMRISQKNLKESSSTCMTSIETNQCMLKNGWHYADILSCTCTMNGPESKDITTNKWWMKKTENIIYPLKEMYSHWKSKKLFIIISYKTSQLQIFTWTSISNNS